MSGLSVDAPLLTGRSPALSINGKVAALAAAILLGGAAAI
jgi:phosphopantothenate synthetase